MSAASADRDLVFGLLAWQLHFLSREHLTAALAAWAVDKSRPLAEILREQGALGDAELGVLNDLARRHLAHHRDDLRQSLAALDTQGSLRQILENIPDAASRATVSHALAAPPDHPGGKAEFDSGTPAGPGGRFRVLRPHAKGGLGQVSVALDGELNREVALKEIQPQYADHPESRTRFLLEAEITGGLEHPGVVPVYGLGKHPDGRPFYAMRFIRGDSLKDAIDRFHKDDVPGRDPGERGLALRQLLGRFVDVCDAMAYAHSRGVLHRDLKPGNVMLGKYGETLVVDWGLAKSLGASQPSEEFAEGTLRPSGAGSTPTQMGKAVGTPAYMSPEQAAGRLDLLGSASDVYSLGATLYALLTGKPPVKGLTLDAMLRRVQEGDFPAPRQVKPQVASALEAVCLKAMALKPEDRYGSAKELAEDVEHWLAGEPVKAWPEPWAVRAGRLLRRHRTLVASRVAALAVAALVLAGATVLLSTAYENERAAKEAAEAARREEAAAKGAALAAEADAKTQRDEALQQRKRADANFAKAKKAVENYLTKVSDHSRLKQHDFLDLRKELLRTALPFYDDLRKQQAGDPGLEAERGRAYGRLAVIRVELGETEQALRDYERMRGIFARLAKAHPAAPDYRAGLAESYSNQGIALAGLGKRLEAEAAYREAIKLQEPLARDDAALPDYRRDLARSHNALGALLLSLGKRPEAEAAFREALKLREALAKAHPAQPDYRWDLAQSHLNLGVLLLSLGRRPEAEAASREAIRLQEALVKAHPAEPVYRRDLAGSRNNQGNALADLGKWPEAEAAYREALKLYEILAKAHPSQPDYRRDLARSHSNLGNALDHLGKRPEAEAAYREALKLQEPLARDYPAVPEYRLELAGSLNNLGNLLADLRRLPEAEAAYRKALKLQEALARADPAVPEYCRDLAASHFNLGALLMSLRKWAEAEAAYREALKLQDALAKAHPDVPEYRRDLALIRNNLKRLLAARNQERFARALALARSGEHAPAAAAAEALVKGNTSNALYYGEARILAVCSAAVKDDAKLREKYAARAVELLSELHEEGYFDTAKNAARLKKDADLDPLRQRDDFRKLLAQIDKAP